MSGGRSPLTIALYAPALLRFAEAPAARGWEPKVPPRLVAPVFGIGATAIVLFGPNKRKLRRAREAIAGYLITHLNLRMKRNWQIWPLRRRPLDFVGNKFYRDRTTLRRHNYLRLKRQASKIRKRQEHGRGIPYMMAAGFISRVGMLKHCDGRTIFKRYVEPVGVGRVKEVIRNESKRRSAAGCAEG